MKHHFGLLIVMLLLALMQGCAATKTLDVETTQTYDLVDTPTSNSVIVQVSDVRPEADRQELRIDAQRLRLGDLRFTMSPDKAVAMHLTKLSLDPAIPAPWRQQLQAQPVHLKEFNVRITVTEALEERPSGGLPGMAAVDYLVRSAVNASMQAGWVDLQIELEIGGKQFMARRGKKFAGNPSSDHTQWTLDAAMLEIRRQLIARPLVAQAE